MTPRLLNSSRVLLVGSSEWVKAFAGSLRERADGAVHVVETAAQARDTIDQESVDCLITAYNLPGATGIELLKSVRERTATLPVVMGATDGSEVVASAAVGAGISEYVVVNDPIEASFDELVDRTEQALRSARRTATQRERAQQFDAVFDDAQTATWVLEPDGALTRTNETAREMIDANIEAVIGDPFWVLPWWSEADAVRRDLEQLVATARDGRCSNAVITQPGDVESLQMVDLSMHPVENKRGEVVSIVVEGVDVTDRVELERDLRRSEQLHRVTLNNMTDTVLITDEDGEYTYVCPNVHFIFGYTAEEIHEQGTIDELLGDELFDREELAERGVLKNIECTATDKLGREHTLLVNVREVSIQDGTVLYSCRDITKRKQREAALTTLQETAREFLYAETHQEIAQQVVDVAPRVLDLDASAVYWFDADENNLSPAASSSAMRDLHGPLPQVHADGETLPGYSFVEGESLFFEDVHGDDRLDNWATGLRSVAYIPLGDHGVFVAGSGTVGAFDDVLRELADLLAATAEAAIDRVTRESRLREQERKLQQQNNQLTTLNRINETIREIDRAVVQAQTREEIDHAVCERLTGDDRFSFAWIGAVDPTTETVEPRAWAGNEQGYLDSQTFTASESGAEPAGRSAATGEVTTVANVATGLRDEPWRTEALTRDYTSVVSIPLVYNGFTHGILTVYADAPDAFDDTVRAVLTELGDTIASALSAIERKNALMSTSTTRVEFEIDDPTFVLSRLAHEADCTLAYQGGIQQTTDANYVFVTVRNTAVDAVVDAAAGLVAIDGVQRISTDEGGGVLRLRLTGVFLAPELAEHGAVFREATATPTSTTIVVDIPESIELRNVTRLLQETFDNVDLRSKQTRDHAVERDLYSTLRAKLTDRQLEVVQTAYYSGYFVSPRESTGEDVAATLGISAPAFYQHVRTVQRKLFETLFEEGGAPVESNPK